MEELPPNPNKPRGNFWKEFKVRKAPTNGSPNTTNFYITFKLTKVSGAYLGGDEKLEDAH